MLLRLFLIGMLLAAPIVLSLGSQRLAEKVGPPDGLPRDAVLVPLTTTVEPAPRTGRALKAPAPARKQPASKTQQPANKTTQQQSATQQRQATKPSVAPTMPAAGEHWGAQ